MSLVNFAFSEKRAAIVTDTLATVRYEESRPIAFHHKFDIVPLVPALFSGRGLVNIDKDVLRQVHLRYSGDGLLSVMRLFDRFLPLRLTLEAAEQRLACIKAGKEPDPVMHEAFLIGWCAETGNMRAFSWNFESNHEARELSPGAYANPNLRGDEFSHEIIRLPMSESWSRNEITEKLIDAAKLQHAAYSVETGQSMPVGGELVLVEMTSRQCLIETVHRFPDYDECAARMNGDD